MLGDIKPVIFIDIGWLVGSRLDDELPLPQEDKMNIIKKISLFFLMRFVYFFNILFIIRIICWFKFETKKIVKTILR